jgi:RTA1 like protein
MLFTAVQLISHRKETPNRIGATLLFMGTPILEFAGFVVRIVSVEMLSNKGLYLANMIILNLGPLYLTAVSWFVFPALIMHVGPRYSLVRPKSIQVLAIVLLCSCIHLTARGM